MAYKPACLGKRGVTWSLIKQSLSPSMVVMTLFGTGGQVAVTIFIMISSWLMADRKLVRSRKIMLLILKTAIISVGVYLIALGAGLVSFSSKALIKELITPLFTQYWFITCYCIYYFVVPLLNSLFENKSDAALKAACIALVLIVTIYHAIIGGPFGDIVWFIFIHIVVLYIKRIADSWSNKKVYKCTVAFLLLWYIAVFADLLIVDRASARFADFIFNILVYRSLPVLLVSLGLFEVGRRFRHKFSYIWTRLGAFTLPVYIVHENFIWYEGVEGSLLWNSIFKVENYSGNPMFLAWIPFVVAVVFICGIIASKIADLIIWPFNGIITKASEWFDRMFGSIYE